MALKKAEFNADEVSIFEEALVYKRGEYWQMRMWLAKEHKYARFSLKTRNRVGTCSLKYTSQTCLISCLAKIE